MLETIRYICLSTILQLYGAIDLSRKPFALVQVYRYTFLLIMVETMASQNIDISAWNTLCVWCDMQIVSFVPETNCNKLKQTVTNLCITQNTGDSLMSAESAGWPALLSDAGWLSCWTEPLLMWWPCDRYLAVINDNSINLMYAPSILFVNCPIHRVSHYFGIEFQS
jgi:hypothetical protein